ncbi:hypothetical protein ALI22I_05845 [Saccharothrix sp. ALI-22-I]|nr:hypothetical protein ALI22I_05845 [Saccharothrix sp. ALI-22-I]
MVAALVTATALAVPAPAQADVTTASTIGGNITRTEVLARATDWYNRRNNSDMTYSQAAKAWDVGRTRQYRRDCSGYVGMAWHLGSDPNTDGLDDPGLTVSIARSDLRPGDLLNDRVDDDGGRYPYHAILFGGWENSAKTRFWYYSFGSTPLDKVTGASFSQSTLSGHPTSHYRALRYRNIVEDIDIDLERVSDFSGDGHSDVLGVAADGKLLYYPNNDLALSPPRELGHGWGGFSHVMAADFSGDGAADVLGVTADGKLLYYPNNDYALSPPRELGHGWGGFSHVMASDFSGDGHADVLGVAADGKLLYYPNNNLALSSPREIGHGWGSFSHVM